MKKLLGLDRATSHGGDATRRRTRQALLVAFCVIGGASLLSVSAATANDLCVSIGTATFCSGGPGGGSPNPAPVAQNSNPLHSGLYYGRWKDGRPMIERVAVAPNQITLTRMAGGDVEGQTFTYIRSGPDQYNSPSGHLIFVTSRSSFTWTNSKGQNGVAYVRQ